MKKRKEAPSPAAAASSTPSSSNKKPANAATLSSSSDGGLTAQQQKRARQKEKKRARQALKNAHDSDDGVPPPVVKSHTAGKQPARTPAKKQSNKSSSSSTTPVATTPAKKGKAAGVSTEEKKASASTTSSSSSTKSTIDLSKATPDQVLGWLLAPITVDQFFTEYWEQKPLHIKRGNTGYFGDMFAKSVFDRALVEKESHFQYGFNLNLCVCRDGRKIDMNPRKSKAKNALAEALAAKKKANRKPLSDDDEAESKEGGHDDDDSDTPGNYGPAGSNEHDGNGGKRRPQYSQVRSDDVQRLHRDKGCTIQVLHPQQYSDAMWRVNAALESKFGALVGANVYITPPDSQGLAPHHDDVDVFICQVEGSKSWKLYKPLMELPKAYSHDFTDDEIGDIWQEVELKQGDLLYFPRGTIHQARASSSTSTHVTISTYQGTSYYHYLQQLLPQALDAAFESSIDYRRGLPLGLLHYMGSSHVVGYKTGEDVEGRKLAEEWEKKHKTKKPSKGKAAASKKDEKEEDDEEEDPEELSTWICRGTQGVHLARPQQQQFGSTIGSLIHRLADFVDLHAATDAFSADFVNSRLPPPPPAVPATGSKKGRRASSTSFGSSAPSGPEPQPSSLIKFKNVSHIRLLVESDENDRPCATIAHSFNNTREHHMDGRFEHKAEAARFPISYVSGLAHLFAKYPTPVRVDSLPVEASVDDDENDDNDDEDKSEEEAEHDRIVACTQLATELWALGILECVDEHDDDGDDDANTNDHHNHTSDEVVSTVVAAKKTQPVAKLRPALP